MSQSLLPTALSFLGILLLIPVALWLLKRTPMGGGATSGQMRVIATQPISPSQRLLIVEVGQGEDRRWLVLGVTGQNIATLHTMAPQPEVPGAAAPSFSQLLGKFGNKGPGNAQQ
ncbi:flagellar biosynthetic protein FliO [Burkholderiaceae bacterium UC74_6]